MKLPTQSSPYSYPSARYLPPQDVRVVHLDGSGGLEPVRMYVAGDITLLERPAVAVIGSRSASDAALAASAEVARWLVGAGYVVLSGLAAGVDTGTHRAAIEA